MRARAVADRPDLDAAALEAVGILADMGLDVLVLKGPALARLLYDEDEQRGYSDIDLLVAPADLAAAGGVLEVYGFVDRTRSSNRELFVDDPHAVAWERGTVTIDLHWRLPGCSADPRTAWDALRARRTWLELGGARVPVLDVPGLALHLCLHAAQHGPQDHKAIADLTRGLERWPLEIWHQAADLAEKVGAIESLSAGLRLLPAGEALAARLELPASDALVQEIIDRDSRPRGVFHLRALSEATSLHERARVLRLSLFPPRWWMLREQRLACRGRPGLLVAHVVHLMRAPRWAVRALLFERRTRTHPKRDRSDGRG